MKTTLILNDAPYGSERSYNALRLAMALQREPQRAEVTVFLMADAVACAVADQKTPEGYYNVERMLKGVLAKGGKVKLCTTCIEARGGGNWKLIEGAALSTMAELAKDVADADQVIVF